MSEVVAVLTGFLASALLYKRTHEPGFPELGRYAVGGLLVVLVHGILYPPGDQERERLGRRCRAVEISPAYVAVTLQRWADATGGTPVRLENAKWTKGY